MEAIFSEYFFSWLFVFLSVVSFLTGFSGLGIILLVLSGCAFLLRKATTAAEVWDGYKYPEES